ncbi:tetratricopeptide repeat protein [Pseudenhygromyxa sp. WMMC2535]|uniref:tetratricopeptide repeat protein n=1 Tax=Pseudenhygromyxa sp. WMMC2535 TaxID=2712867 RepID=UPI0015546131|nr:tetratricopeptide repeat protein [Pseudenhygromyxa sp. WMMC2535]NVB36327.1 tetratricopeptide repeat protein [Pseudenhygromyxa sp. WMMC2535]
MTHSSPLPRPKPHASTLICLALSTGLLTACGTKDPTPSVTPTDEPRPAQVELEAPNEQALAEFHAAYAAFEAAEADGALDEAECAALSAGFNQVYDAHPRSMLIARFNAGAVLESCGRLDEAIAIYTELAHAGFHLALNNLGVLEWERGNTQLALDLFARSVDANKVQAVAARNNLAAIHRDRYALELDADDFATAEKEIKNVLAVDTSNKAAYENLARLYYDRGRLEDQSYLVLANLVVTQAMRVLEKDGRQSAALWNLRGLLFMEDDNQVDGLRAFERAVEIDPEHADASRNIGFIAIRFRDYAGAVAAFEVALHDEAVQRDPEVYIAMGVAKRGLQDYPEAERWYREAMKVDSADPRPWYNLAVLNQDHLISQEGVERPQIEAFYATAKGHCETFETMAKGQKRYTAAVADCIDRVAIIDDALHTFAVMDEITRKSEEIRIAAEKAELERRERLLERERAALAAGAEAVGVVSE